MEPKQTETPRIRIKPIVNISALFVILLTVLSSIYTKLQVGEQAISDVLIYREGAIRFWEQTLYDSPFDGVGYWTYPPFGAMFFSPLALIPVELVEAIWASFSLLLVGVLIFLGLKETAFFETISNKVKNIGISVGGSRRLSVLTSLGSVAILTILSISLGQVHHHLVFGQIELFLAVLVGLDYIVIRKRFPKYYGYLTGLAAAIKLTPIAFVGMYLFLGHYRAVIRSIISLGTVWGIAAIINWKNTYEYFFAGRLSNLAAEMNEFTEVFTPANQSLLGFAMRRLYPLSEDGTVIGEGISYDAMSNAFHIYMAVALVIGLVSAYLARRLHLKGDSLSALAIIGVTVALLSPYSWIYHHIWIIFAFIIFLRKPKTWKTVVLATTALLWTAPAVQIATLFSTAPQPLRAVFWELYIAIDVLVWVALTISAIYHSKTKAL